MENLVPTKNRAACSTDAHGESESGDEAQDEEPPSSRTSQVKSELETFREQWKNEIKSVPSKGQEKLLSKEKGSHDVNLNTEDAVEEKARTLFLCGVQAERLGKLQDAISLYRRAIQLVPDIEFKIDDMGDIDDDDFFEESEQSDIEENSDDETNIDNLLEKFQIVFSKLGTTSICVPKVDQNISHISTLPVEIFLYILKWVVSQDLDVVSLEQVAKVCRGFYVCSRDDEIWRLICLRTWGATSESLNRYGSWRNMFLQRPRVCFHGVYISKTTYVRYGESSFQDLNYRPCYLVEYYRYLRFYPDGAVLMLTTPDDPYQSVYQLCHSKSNKHPNILSGRYKLVGNIIMAVVKKHKIDSASNYYKIRRHRHMNIPETQDQTFHLELEVKNFKKRINCQLNWICYSIHNVYRNGQETVTNFEIVPSKFPSFWFSRVKSFTAVSENSLK